MIDVKTRGGIARIFLNRHEKANALDSHLLEELLEAFTSLASTGSLRASVLGGHGRVFCGGADVNELAKLDEADAAAFVERIHAVCQAIRDLPVPVVARLHGAVMAIDARRACEWGLAGEVGGDEALERVLKSLLAGDREALKVQKELLQLWEEAPLRDAVTISIEAFSRMAKLRR